MKERTIASVAASYGLVAQTVGNWYVKVPHRRRGPEGGGGVGGACQAECREPRAASGERVPKKAAAFFAKEPR